ESGDGLDLLTGSEGTLAFTTAVEWRLEPIPADVAGAALGFERLEQVAEAVPYLVALNPSAVELLDRTLLDFVRAAAAPPGLPEGLEALLLIEFERETQAAARGVVGDAVRGLRGSTAHVATAADRASPETLWAVRRTARYGYAAELVRRRGGTPSGEHGVGRLRAGLLERFYGPEVAALFRELKQAYDPRCTLNPGVIIPSADWAPLADLKVGPEAAPIPDDIAARLREVERTAAWATPKLDLANPNPHAPNP